MFEPVSADALQGAKKEAEAEVFRLEYRRLYSVEADLRQFARWKRGERAAIEDQDDEYRRELRALRERGVRSVRVRIVDFPIEDYLRYEIDYYRASEPSGEEVFFIERAPAIDCMQETVVTQDFWLFDGKVVLLWKYTKEGQRDGQEESSDEETVDSYRELRDCLLRRALRMDDFIDRYRQSFSAASTPA